MIVIAVYKILVDVIIDRQTNRKTYKHTDRHTNRQTDRQIDFTLQYKCSYYTYIFDKLNSNIYGKMVIYKSHTKKENSIKPTSNWFT